MATVQGGGIDLELPACPVCQEEYEIDEVVPISMECGHSICRSCLNNLKESTQAMACPTCRATSANWSQLPKNYKLEEAVSIIKKLKELPPPPENPVKCSSCLKIDDEADMYICHNCTLEFHGKDIRESLNPQDQSDIEAMAICGRCARRNHVDHDTIPYFSILSGFLFTSQLTSVTLLRDELQNQVSRVGEWAAHYGESARILFNELDKMTGMMMKSKSSSIQRYFYQRIGEEITAFSEHSQKIVEKFKDGEDTFELRFNSLQSKNKIDEETNCREIVSRDAEKKCIECSVNQPRAKMYCCQECSEIVKRVLNDTLTASDAQSLYFDTLLICADCILGNHCGPNHKHVKFTDVDKSYESVKRRHRVEKKEEILRARFARLTDTFERYTLFLHNYEQKITKMSKIAAECKGDLNHDIVLREFEKTLDDAELSVQSLQVNTEKEKTVLTSKEEKRAEEDEECEDENGKENEEAEVDEQMNDEADA